MKKFYLLLSLLLSVGLLLPSCNESPKDNPVEPEQPVDPDPEPEEKAPFEIAITDKTEIGYTMNITPTDKEMLYVYLTESSAIFDELNLDTQEEIFAHDLEMFIDQAEAFEMDVEGLMNRFYINSGDIIDLTISGFAPGKEFVVYAYGVAFENGMPVPTTELVMVRDTTLDSTPIEQPISVTAEVNGSSVDLHIDPQGYTGRYLAFVEPVASWVSSPNPTEEELKAAAIDMWYDYFVPYLRYGYTTEMLLEEYTYEGVLSSQQDLDANTDYFVAAVPISDNCVVYGYPSVKSFRTGDVNMSNNVLTLSVKDIKPREATVVITTTNDDPYLLACFTKSNFEGKSDEEIIDYYLTNYGYDFVINGDLEFPMTGLEPNTEYFFAAFGCQNGVVTTDLYTCDFRTAEEGVAELSIDIEIIGFFDTKEVAALDYNYADFTSYDALLPWRVVTNPQAEYVYRAMYKSSQVANVSDETLKETLMQGSPKTSFSSVNFATYNNEYVLCAVAVDANGNVSDLCRSEPIAVTYDNRHDAQKFIDYIYSPQSKVAEKSVVIPVRR